MNPKIAAYTTKNWIYFLLIVLSFVLYGNNIQNDYGFDDTYVETANPYVQKGIAGIPDIFNKPYATIDGAVLDYRPVVLITFAVEHQFFKGNPHISHFINILLYALGLIVLYHVLIIVFKLDREYPFLPFVITLFFAVHPLHTEIVDSLKNRDELLVLLFGLLYMLYGYYYFTKESRRKTYALISLFFLVLTLMSKITGLVFVAIFIPVCIFNNFFKKGKWSYLFIFISVLMVIRAAVRAFEGANRQTTVFENPLSGNKDLLVIFGTACRILLYHLKMLVFPSPLRFYYGANMFPVVNIINPLALISFVLHAALLVFGISRFLKKDNLGLFILCYFIAIAIYANFPVLYTSMFSERALFLSSLWFVVIIAVIAVRIWNKYKVLQQSSVYKNAIALFIAVVFVCYSFMTISRNFLWKNTLTLMSHDIEFLENSVLANYIYANNLRYESKISKDAAVSKELANKAVYYYQHAIYLKPNYPEFYYKVASTYRYNLKNLDSAEVNYGYAISIDSLYGDANYELSKLFFDKQDFKRSNYFFAKTYAIQPTDSLTLFYYAQSASNVGDMATAYKTNQEFLKLYPNLPYPYLNLGMYYSKNLKDDSAIIYLDKAINLGYREPQLISKLAYYFEQKGNTAKVKYYKSLQ